MNNNQLVVHLKNNKDKWINRYYPFYWANVETIDFDNSYIIVQANKSNFAESRYSLSVLEYQKENL